jgi:hypothetical protein
MSDDDRFVAFLSEYENLVPGDTNGSIDAFVRDRETGTTERVSLTDAGAQAQYGALTARDSRVAISGEGRFVAFASGSSDLVPGLQFFADRVYVRDRARQQTELVSVRSDGSVGYTTGGFNPSLGAGGRLVAFESASNDLVSGDTNGVNDVFVHDRETGATERISLTGAGAQACAPPGRRADAPTIRPSAATVASSRSARLSAHVFDAPGEYWVLLIVNDGELDSPTSVGSGSYATVTIGEAPATGECVSVPVGPTYDSIECRLLAARTTTLESAATSRMRNRMIVELDMARKRLDAARGFCAAGNARKAKARVRAMRSWIDAYARRMKSSQARTLVPDPTRTQLAQAAAGMRVHVNAMARGMVCPQDAGAP